MCGDEEGKVWTWDLEAVSIARPSDPHKPWRWSVSNELPPQYPADTALFLLLPLLAGHTPRQALQSARESHPLDRAPPERASARHGKLRRDCQGLGSRWRRTVRRGLGGRKLTGSWVCGVGVDRVYLTRVVVFVNSFRHDRVEPGGCKTVRRPHTSETERRGRPGGQLSELVELR